MWPINTENNFTVYLDSTSVQVYTVLDTLGELYINLMKYINLLTGKDFLQYHLNKYNKIPRSMPTTQFKNGRQTWVITPETLKAQLTRQYIQ